MKGIKVEQLKFGGDARKEYKRRKVQRRYEKENGFFNWHLSKYCIESLLRYGNVYHAYDLCLADKKGARMRD